MDSRFTTGIIISVGAFALAATLSQWPCVVAAAQSVPPSRTLRLPATPYRYATLDLPAHFRGDDEADNTPDDNPLSDEGATLGRVLFYDTQLSANNSTSCGSCHVQKHAFADANQFSRGFEGGLTDRHAMNLTNLRYYLRARFFWDERGGNLEEMVLLPIANRLEMGEDVTRLPQKLAQMSYYSELFRRAFGDAAITEQRIAKALAQFLRSMVSYESRYDEGLAHASSQLVRFENFTRQENHGKALFLRNCANCHQSGAAHFFVLVPTNNGLDASVSGTDGGIGDITLNSIDQGRFKSPSLRNAEVAGPYMHDGRLPTLEAVVDHYSRELQPHPNIDGRMRPRNFTDSEKAALVAFLKTLTDTKFLADPKFSDPFGAPPTRDATVRVSGRPVAAAGPTSAKRGVPIEAIVARVLSFDVNGDAKVTSDELNDRMDPLIVDGDRNGDGGLDAAEIAAYSRNSSPLSFGALRGQLVMPSLAVQLPRLDTTIEALLDDLDLPSERRERALRALAGYNAAEPMGLMRRLEPFLTADELNDFTAAFSRREPPLLVLPSQPGSGR